MSDDQKYRCTLPFSHLNVTARGVTTPCCNYDWRKNDHWKLADSDYNYFTWVSEGLENILYSAPWRELRKKSKKNIPEPGCHHCYFSDNSVGSSRRTWANDVFPDADNDTKLKSIELKLGAKCNLECRTCSPNSSNKLLKEGSYERFGKVDKDWIRHLQSFSDWTHDENFWDDLKKVSSDLEYLQFTGGEPLLIQEQYQYLEWLAENNIDPVIQYITNATIPLDEYKINLWNKFSKIIIDFSIDGADEVAEYVRTGSNWEEQKNNIIEYGEYVKQHNILNNRKDSSHNSSINLATTVSIYNVTEIRGVLDFIHDNNVDISSWSINIVRWQNWMDIANLKGEAKQYALDNVNSLMNDTKYKEKYRNKLQEVIDRIETDPVTGAKFTDLVEKKQNIHNLLNKNRHHDFSKLLPEWWDILVKSGM